MSLVETNENATTRFEVRVETDTAAGKIINALLSTGMVESIYLRQRKSEPGKLLIVALRDE